MMHVEPQKEHHWLQKLVGEWDYEHDACMEPGQPPSKFTGTDSVRTVGEVWIVCEGRGEMPGGGDAKTMMMLGYDPVRKRFVGTFIGSMMTHLWVYDGELDPSESKLTLDTEGPSFTGDGTMAKYKDVIEFMSNDHRTLTSHVLGEDSLWTEIMTAHYRRKN